MMIAYDATERVSLHDQVADLLELTCSSKTITAAGFFARVYLEYCNSRMHWLENNIRYPSLSHNGDAILLPEWTVESIVAHFTHRSPDQRLIEKIKTEAMQRVSFFFLNNIIPTDPTRPLGYFKEFIQLETLLRGRKN